MAVDQMRQHDGLLTHEDFESYRVHRREPHSVEFLGARLQTNPPPSFGGSIVCRALAEIGNGVSRRPTARALVESLHHATVAQKAETHAAGIPTTSTGTTHISVVDSDGTLVSMTTSNGSCSGVLIPGTGVQLNNMMGEADLHPTGFHGAAPGTRVASMMAPSLLDLPDGSVVALGSGGSERIRSALLQTIMNLVEGASVTEAVTAPRVHFDGEVIQLEPEVPNSIADELADVAPLNRWTRPSLYFGGVNAVARRPNGDLEAAGDARRGGVGVIVDI
jgi:gamma-glutamyltranspeptidase/glutathione hydrolase